MPETPSQFRRVKDTPASIASHELDLQNAFEWLDALERRVARVEGMTEVVAAIRADVATIVEGVDPALATHVAELAGTVENHGLLLARLLDDKPAD